MRALAMGLAVAMVAALGASPAGANTSRANTDSFTRGATIVNTGLHAAFPSAERALQLAPAATDGAAPSADLSERELVVLRLLATDLSQREIASQLYVSFNTVKSHTRTVFRKLDVKTREAAVARGRELGLL